MALKDNALMDRLQTRLEAREVELRAEVEALRAEEAGTLGKAPGGHAEDAGEHGEAQTRNAVRSMEQLRDTQELRDIAAARLRISEGHYGECADCGVDIPLARLQAQPAAARCVVCQERFERSVPIL
ncbi:MAG: TraR/DksA family transcriptional regulator, partial [Rhizobacter sp.]